MTQKLPQQIAYVDEAGIDNREDYAYGYCEVGQRFYALKLGKRTERVSWIAADRTTTNRQHNPIESYLLPS